MIKLYEITGVGSGCTTIVSVVLHPVGKVYTMTALPPLCVVTMPLVAPMVASDGVVVLQVPPGVASCKVSVSVAHKPEAPVMGAGNGFTTSDVDTVQPGMMV